MKRRTIVILSIVVLIFLIVRPIYNYVKNFLNERKWYVEQLKFDLSGEVDSVVVIKEDAGFILFHLTRGKVDGSHEENLNRKLEHNGRIRLLAFKKDEEIEMFTLTPTLYLPGDSVYINTDKNTVTVYRSGQEISKDLIKSHLQGY